MKRDSKISSGDIVLSTAGRDKGVLFLVVDTDGKTAFVTDGKIRKTTNPKKKNVKHLKIISPQAYTGLARDINTKKPVSDERVKKAIKEYKKI
ncbi:MAG: RNA-binding protein [Clostridia bacterium]|nr:RNA-binding protein [Clostridia bacterium]